MKFLFGSVSVPWLTPPSLHLHSLAPSLPSLLLCVCVCVCVHRYIWHFYPSMHVVPAAAAAKSLQSCLTLCDPIDGSPSGSPVPGILQARTLEWVAVSFSNAGKWKVKVKSLSRVRLFATPCSAAHQAPPPSMGFSRQEHWYLIQICYIYGLIICVSKRVIIF